MLTSLPRKLWLLVCAIGVVIAAVFALIPVGVDFGDDPLLRLRQLDPVLSPPDTTAMCGSPVRNFDPHPEGNTLHELARTNACRAATRRRLLVAAALGAVILMTGLIGLTASRDPDLITSFGYPWPEGNVGRGRPETARSG